MKYFFFIISFVVSNYSYSQKKLDLTIVIDSNIEPKNLKFEYFNGHADRTLTDTFVNNVVCFKMPFYSEFFPLKLSYTPEKGLNVFDIFFVQEGESKIFIHKSNFLQDNGKIDYLFSNVQLVTDTSNNSTYRDFQKTRSKIGNSISQFYLKHQVDVTKIDSLKSIRNHYFLELNSLTMNFLKNHAEEYFAFYFFSEQIVSPSISMFRNDSSYLRSLITYFKKTFPKRVQESFEGKNLLLFIESIISPPNIDTKSPMFSKVDLEGKKLSSRNLKGKYVVLDFWASWCPPCMASVASLKKLSLKYPTDSFAIIGINLDENIKTATKFALDMKMSWRNIFDDDYDMSNKFGVLSLPTFILLNKEGDIIFRGIGLDEEEKMENYLNEIFHSKK